MKPLDIVMTPKGNLAIVTEVNKDGSANIDYFASCDATEKNAWWDPIELDVLDSIPRLLSNALSHPFGSNKKQGDRYFPLDK